MRSSSINTSRPTATSALSSSGFGRNRGFKLQVGMNLDCIDAIIDHASTFQHSLDFGKDWHGLQRTMNGNRPATVIDGFTARFARSIDISPPRPIWQIHLSPRLSCLQHWRTQILRPIHILILLLPTHLIMREVVEARSHDRITMFMSRLHQASRISPHFFSAMQILGAYG